MDIKAFKLITGEEIIGKVGEESNDTIKLDDVRTMFLSQGKDGLHVELIPFLISNKDATVEIEKTHIVASPMTINPDLEKQYLQITSSLLLR